MRGYATVLLGIALLAGILALVFRDRVAALSPGQIGLVVMLVMALMVVAGPALSGRGRSLGPHWLRNIAVWVALALAIAVLYGIARPYLPADFGMR
jgi:glycerol uptake facilitator-like aquaporin